MIARCVTATAVLIAPSFGSAEGFAITLPEISASAAPSAFEITLPPIAASAAPSAFAISLPPITAASAQSAFSITLPPVTASAAASGFSVTLPPITASAAPSAFAVTLPPIMASAANPEDATDADTMDCQHLLACFVEPDIGLVAGDLRSLGYAPETHPRFCENVAQSLGGCSAQPPGAGPTTTSSTDPGSPGTGPGSPSAGPNGPSPDSTAPGAAPNTPNIAPMTPSDAFPDLNFARCPPFENYVIALQAREDQGENVDAEAQLLIQLSMSATFFILNERTDAWCEYVTPRLPR